MHVGSSVAACMWDLVPRPGMEPRPPALGVQGLTHWTTREAPVGFILFNAITSRGRQDLLSLFTDKEMETRKV